MSLTNIATFLPDDEGDFVVKETSYVKPEPGEVVIKNAAMAVNPSGYRPCTPLRAFPSFVIY
jgi:NADPH:quinone reductase-like Zn-dependent oxidoreductase